MPKPHTVKFASIRWISSERTFTFLAMRKKGDSHHNHIQRIIGEEQFQHFISALW